SGHAWSPAVRTGLRRVRSARWVPQLSRPPGPLYSGPALFSPGQRVVVERLAPAPSGAVVPGPRGPKGTHPMTFTETPFVYFLLVLYPLWLLLRRHYRAKLVVLLVASLVFYGYHKWTLLFLVLSYCLVNWAVGCWIGRSRRP